MTPFEIKPKHWWSYLNPFWWKQKRIMEAVMKYQLEKLGLNEKVEKALADAWLTGTGSVEIDWLAEDKKHD